MLASKQLRRPGELLPPRFFLLTNCFRLWAHRTFDPLINSGQSLLPAPARAFIPGPNTIRDEIGSGTHQQYLATRSTLELDADAVEIGRQPSVRALTANFVKMRQEFPGSVHLAGT